LSKVSPDSRIPAAKDGKELSFDKDAEMHYHLGIAYKEMELFDYAITEFELASQDSTIQFDCGIMLGACYMERGDYDRAIESFKKVSAIEEIPPEKLARLHYNLGLAYEANGMVSDAVNTFRLVLELDRSNSDAQQKIEKLQPAQK
jgi:tetratricopeptide (TPR) repeat protein